MKKNKLKWVFLIIDKNGKGCENKRVLVITDKNGKGC